MTTRIPSGTRKTKGGETKSQLRRAYREKREARLQELAARLDLWEAKAKKAKADARIRAVEEIGRLRGKLEAARLKLSLLQDAGEAAREDVKAGVEAAMRDLRAGFRRASSRFE